VNKNISLLNSSKNQYFNDGLRSQFSQYRLSSYKKENEIFNFLLNNKINKFYILGDLPITYLYANSDFPYIQNLYNMAPPNAQKKVISWIEENNINNIIIDVNYLKTDEVQNTIRLPYLYKYVLNNFKPNIFKDGIIYADRVKINNSFLNDWKRYLGSGVNLGFIPDNNIPDANDINSNLIKITLVKYTPGKVVNINVFYKDSKFLISFNPKSSGIFYIPMSHVWFLYNYNYGDFIKFESLDDALVSIN
jgi:hypothetical protein